MPFTREEIDELNKFASKFAILNINSPTDTQVELAKSWLLDAKRELEAYKVLKNSKFYAQMVEHLALCTEKVVKSFGFLTGSVSNNSVRDIGHISPRVFIKLVEDTNVMKFLEANFEEYKKPEFNLDYQNFKEIIMSKKPKRLETDAIKITKEEIKVLFDFSDKLKLMIDSDIGNKNFEEFLKTNNSIKKYFSTIIPIIKKDKEWKKMKDIRISELFIAGVENVNMFLLSLILFSFYNPSRYSLDYQIKFEEGLGIIDSIELVEKKVLEALSYVDGQINKYLQI